MLSSASISKLVARCCTIVFLPVIIHCRLSGGCLLILHSLHDTLKPLSISNCLSFVTQDPSAK